MPNLRCLWQSWDPRPHASKVRSRVLSLDPGFLLLPSSCTGQLSIPRRKLVEQFHSRLDFGGMRWGGVEGGLFKFYPLISEEKCIFFIVGKHFQLGLRNESGGGVDCFCFSYSVKAQDNLSPVKVIVNISLWLVQTHITHSTSLNNIILFNMVSL